jgi:hypothetical protein
MDKTSVTPEPNRILQIYNPETQKAFRNWSSKDKLEWLESINHLYWAAKNEGRSDQAA